MEKHMENEVENTMYRSYVGIEQGYLAPVLENRKEVDLKHEMDAGFM